MAACTLALSPSSAKVVVCKRTFLRASSHGPTHAQRITGATSATESAGVAAAKGLTGKRKAWGNEAMKAIPCARQLSAQWHNSRDKASRSAIGLQPMSYAILPRAGAADIAPARPL